ncbi:MAG TPA: hypothetical protein VN951_03095 [Pyrinomonadaceae bacterium]|nr:hypothetical protein [Pyrinomonadaceae bacterium]
MLTKKELVERMLRPLNQPVSFTYPGTDGPLRGILKDRAVIRGGDAAGAKYWDVVDLIEFGRKRSDRCMRISYYRQVGDRLGWAGQTSITEPLYVWKRMFVQAALEKPWFRELLLSTANEIQSKRPA